VVEQEKGNPTKKRLDDKRMYRRNRRYRKWHRKPRFDNRKKPEGWLAPSIERKEQTHVNLVKKIKWSLPVTKVIVEKNSFDIAKIENPQIEGKEYQQGSLYQYLNVKAYLLYMQKNVCALCGKPHKEGDGWHVHHIVPRNKGGSDSPDNLVVVHDSCHKRIHKDGLVLSKRGFGKKYCPPTFMNIIGERLVNDLSAGVTYGYITSSQRNALSIEKAHYNDAFVIAGGTTQSRVFPIYFEQRRRNNRSMQTNLIKKRVHVDDNEPRKAYVCRRIRRKRSEYHSGDIVFVEKSKYICGGMTGGYIKVGSKKSKGGYNQAIKVSPKQITKHIKSGSLVRKADGVLFCDTLSNNKIRSLVGQ
jgi:5-methylcytosine-specific restriction endonuclease McrA